jgi:hypothetical protein
MNIPELCPSCLTELPDGYAFDHVLIDRTLDGNPQHFRAMSLEERREVIRTGRARGLSDNAIAVRVGSTKLNIAALMGVDLSSQLNEKVAEYWAQGLSDQAISMQVGCHLSQVARVRRRLGLAALFGPGGRPANPGVAA